MTAPSTRSRIVDRYHHDEGTGPGAASDGRHATSTVETLLRQLPSHGWTAGWTGRRDRALLVLAFQAGLSFPQIAALTAGDLTIKDGSAAIRTPGGRTTLAGDADSLLCGPCGLARWVHALDLTVVYPDGRVIAALIARAMPLHSSSPHLCESNNAITEITRGMALLPPIDKWGHPLRLSVSSRPARAGAMVSGLPTQRRSVGPGVAANRAHLLRERVDELLAS